MFSCYFVGRRPTGILRGRFYWIWHWSPRYTCFRAAGCVCVCVCVCCLTLFSITPLAQGVLYWLGNSLYIYIYGRGSTGVGLVGGGWRVAFDSLGTGLGGRAGDTRGKKVL